MLKYSFGRLAGVWSLLIPIHASLAAPVVSPPATVTHNPGTGGWTIEIPSVTTSNTSITYTITSGSGENIDEIVVGTSTHVGTVVLSSFFVEIYRSAPQAEDLR